MTTAEPTLEQIRDGKYKYYPSEMCAALADYLLTTIEQADEHCHRLDALERVQRDADDVPEAQLASWVRRAETAERERDEAKADAARWHAHWVTSQQELGQWARRIDPWLKHGMWCHWNGRDQPCTCGLADALASATPAEGGSE